MPDYRVFRLSKTGQIKGSSTFITLENDAQAIERAHQMLDGGGDVEVWEGARRVVDLKSPDPR